MIKNRFKERKGWLTASAGLKEGERSLLAEANADSPEDLSRIDEYERETRDSIRIALSSIASMYVLVRETSVRQGGIKLYLERVL